MNSRIRKKLHTRVRAFVGPDETVQAAFSASTRPTWLTMVVTAVGCVGAIQSTNFFPDRPLVGVPVAAAVGAAVMTIFLLVTPQRVVGVTDQRILVLACRRLTAHTPTRVLRELPRTTRFGAGPGPINVLGEPLWVQRLYKDELRAADAALAA